MVMMMMGIVNSFTQLELINRRIFYNARRGIKMIVYYYDDDGGND